MKLTTINSNTKLTGSICNKPGDLPELVNLAEFFLTNNQHATKPCFIGPHGATSYRQFNIEVRRTASAMTLLGIQAEQRIAISLDDSIDLAVLFFASLAIGALPLVINPNLDAKPLEHILEDATPSLLFAKASRKTSAQEAIVNLAVPPYTVFLEQDLLLAEKQDWLSPAADPDWSQFVKKPINAPAFLQYTSGTTGRSKGVIHSAKSILSSCRDFADKQLHLQPDDILYSIPKAFFGYGMGNSLFFPLYVGATAVLDPRWPSKEVVIENLKQFRPTVLFAVPTLYRMLLDSDLSPADWPVRLAFSAGAPLATQISDKWRSRFSQDLYDGIGATELCHVFATTYPDANRVGSIGRMVSTWQYQLVDEAGSPVKPGKVGALLIQAPSVAIGYWNKPAETAEKFNDNWYRTGDLFSQDQEGFLYFHGREDDRFKVFGRWVIPLEIEGLLATLCPDIGETYLIPGRDTTGEDRPVLFIVNSPGSIFDAKAELAAEVLSKNLESYKQPVLFQPLQNIPLTPNGKVNRRALQALANEALAQTNNQLEAMEN